jgi:hypothetical protein
MQWSQTQNNMIIDAPLRILEEQPRARLNTVVMGFVAMART